MRTLTILLDDCNSVWIPLTIANFSNILIYLDFTWNHGIVVTVIFYKLTFNVAPTHGIGTYREHGSIPLVCLHAYNSSYAEGPDFKFWPGDRIV